MAGERVSHACDRARAGASHRQVADFLLGGEMRLNELRRSSPDRCQRPAGPRRVLVACGVVDRAQQPSDPVVIGHNQLDDVSHRSHLLSRQPGCRVTGPARAAGLEPLRSAPFLICASAHPCRVCAGRNSRRAPAPAPACLEAGFQKGIRQCSGGHRPCAGQAPPGFESLVHAAAHWTASACPRIRELNQTAGHACQLVTCPLLAVIAAGNLAGPLLLGRLFDTVGRVPMIAGTYIVSGVLLFATAYMFSQGVLTGFTMTACWWGVLFFASAGASAAYLTVSEVFPLETRALAIAFFYAIGTAAGGISGPLVFSSLVSTGKVGDTVTAFVVGAALMVAAGIVEIFLGVRAEQRSLEDIAQPLTATDVSPPGQARPAAA